MSNREGYTLPREVRNWDIFYREVRELDMYGTQKRNMYGTQERNMYGNQERDMYRF